MSASRKLEPESQECAELPLFGGSRSAVRGGDSAIDLALEVIDRNLTLWDALNRRLQSDPKLQRDRRSVTELGRDLRGLRDCSLAATHPRIRQALLREAGRITRRMKSLGARLGAHCIDIPPIGARPV